MKVILQQDVKGQGKGDIVNVSDGMRNFLLPRKLAVEATTEALNEASAARRHRRRP